MSNRLDLDLAAGVADYFRVKPAQREKLLRQICSAVSGWERVAQAHGILQSEIERMRPAFRSCRK